MMPQSEPSVEEENRFLEIEDAKWAEISTALGADRPPERGGRFVATLESVSGDGRFTLQAEFGDRVSNRQRGGVPRKVMDQLVELQVAYRQFWQLMAWKRVVIEQIWNRDTKAWAFERRWEY